METEAINAVRKARFTDRLVIKDASGDEYTVTQRELETAKPVYNISRWLNDINDEEVTEAELSKLFTLKSKDTLVGDFVFPTKNVEKVKQVRELQFKVPYTPGGTLGSGFDATLTTDGVLAIGCQEYTLDEWAGSTGDDVLANRFASWNNELGEATEYRNAMIPILRKKLANELAKQQPVKRKKAA